MKCIRSSDVPTALAISRNTFFFKYSLHFWGICLAVTVTFWPEFAAFLTDYMPVRDFCFHLRTWVSCSIIIYTLEMHLHLVPSLRWYSKNYTVFLNGSWFIFVLMLLLFEAYFLKWLELLMLINSYIYTKTKSKYIVCSSICLCVVNSCKQLCVVNKDKKKIDM